MSGIVTYRDLRVWVVGMDLCTRIYQLTETFPTRENYALSSQLRRASVSIPSNIAEGNGRETTRDYLYHLNVAYGSLMEVETQLTIALRMKFCTQEVHDELLRMTSELGKQMNALKNSLRRRLSSLTNGEE
jgi:four helix bundle protein